MKNWLVKDRLVIVQIIAVFILGAGIIFLGSLLSQGVTQLESVLIQILQLILTVVITYIPARYIATKQQEELTRNRARMALRRTFTLDQQMRFVSKHIADQRARLTHLASDNMVTLDNALDSVSSISDMHRMQFGQISAVAEDWSDLIPEEIVDNDEQFGGSI